MALLDDFERRLNFTLTSNDSDSFVDNLLKLENYASQLKSSNNYQNKLIQDRTFNFDLIFSIDTYKSYEFVFENCYFKDIRINAGTSRITFINCKIQNLTKIGFTLGLYIHNNSTILNLILSMSDKNLMIEVKNSTINTITVTTGRDHVFFDNIYFYNSILFKTIWEVDNTHKTKYGRLQFSEVTFKEAPDFLNTEFSKDVIFKKCKFEDLSESAESPYRDLKHKFAEQHDDLMASYFGGLELMSKHDYISAKLERFLSSMYKTLNNYGLSPYRPLKWLGVLLYLAIFFWSLNIFALGPFEIENENLKLNEIEQFLYLSFVSVLGPLKALGIFNLLKIQTLLSQIILFIFNFISSLLWFFLILAIRKRFRVSI